MQWLESRLLQLNADLDVSVFVMYICGILESYSGYDDKKEVLLDIVGEIAEDNKEAVCDELIQKWDEMSNTDSKQGEESTTTAIDERLSQMLGNTHVTTNCTEKKSKQLSEEERARKEAILAQYSNICDETDLDVEAVEDIVDAGGAAPSSTGTLIAAAAATIPAASSINFSLEHNQNKENVIKREKEMREKMKQDNEKKKEKDKQDRDVQKNKKQDRKDMEKKRTQKGERRR